jgi:hypothetical protein
LLLDFQKLFETAHFRKSRRDRLPESNSLCGYLMRRPGKQILPECRRLYSGFGGAGREVQRWPTSSLTDPAPSTITLMSDAASLGARTLHRSCAGKLLFITNSNQEKMVEEGRVEPRTKRFATRSVLAYPVRWFRGCSTMRGSWPRKS